MLRAHLTRLFIALTEICSDFWVLLWLCRAQVVVKVLHESEMEQHFEGEQLSPYMRKDSMSISRGSPSPSLQPVVQEAYPAEKAKCASEETLNGNGVAHSMVEPVDGDLAAPERTSMLAF